jgi:hypothetical protein
VQVKNKSKNGWKSFPLSASFPKSESIENGLSAVDMTCTHASVQVQKHFRKYKHDVIFLFNLCFGEAIQEDTDFSIKSALLLKV